MTADSGLGFERYPAGASVYEPLRDLPHALRWAAVSDHIDGSWLARAIEAVRGLPRRHRP